MTSVLEERPCPRHPTITTRLRCSKCGEPICPRCMVETPVGFRCPSCAGLSTGWWGRTPSSLLIRATLIGLLVALAVGWVWSRFPDWQFYLALALGFGVAETMAWAARLQRGRDLQVTAMVVAAVGLLASRLFFLTDLGIGPAEVLERLGDPRLRSALQLRPIPDLLFAALALLIPFVRFREQR